MQVSTSFRDIWKIAYPIILVIAAVTVLNITDTIFLGRVCEIVIGAAGIAGVFYFVLVMIGNAITNGVQILIARRAGEKKHLAIGEIFDHSNLLMFILGLLLMILLFSFSHDFLKRILSSESITEASARYLYYRTPGMIFILLAGSFRAFYAGISKPKVYGIYSVLMAGLNIFLNYALIFGHFGFPVMGIAGAALASAISEIAGCLYLILYTKFQFNYHEFGLFKFRSYNRQLADKIFKLSSPIIFQSLLSMGAWFIFFVFIEKMGERELAVSNLARNTYMVLMTPVWAFGITANSMVSNIIGQEKHREVLPLIKRIILMASIISGVLVTFSFLFPEMLLKLFTNDPELIHSSMGSLMIVNFASLIFPFAIVCLYGVSGTGATNQALRIEVLCIAMYLAYLGIVVFKVNGSLELAWTSELLYWIATGILSFWFLASNKWHHIKI